MRSIYFGSLRRVSLKQLVTVISAAIIFSVLLILPNKTFATHAAGSDLTYRFISSSGNSSVYEVTVNFYRDCQGVAAPTNISLNVHSNSCNRNFNVTLNKISGTGQEITFPCLTAQTYCSGGTNPGIQLYTYRGQVTLPVKCTDWKFSYSVCCRNCSINTITNQSNCTNANTGNALYVEAVLNNVVSNHSSPSFTNIPVAFVCVNQPMTFNHGAVDPDGHDLVYSFITPKRSATTNVGWQSGYSATNWILSSPQVAINSTTGDITMNPTSVGQVAVCAVLVQEYENGVLIGSIIRDMQFWVRNCGSNSLPTATGINGTGNYSTTVCAGTPVSFTINSNDADAGQTVTMTSNIAGAGIPGSTLTIINNPGSSPNFPKATFNWTPTLADARNSPYVFTVRVQDNACPQNGFQVFSYSIFVPNHTLSFNTSAHNGYNISCNGGNDGTASVNVSGGNTPYTYKWNSGATTQEISNLTAGTYSLTVIDANGCSNTTSVNSVVITEPPVLTVSVTNPVQATCFGNSDGTANAAPSGGVTPYTYLWDNGQTDATATGLTGGQTYSVTVTDNNGCTKSGSVLIGQPAVLSTAITSFSNVSCNGQTTGYINLFVSGGTTGYTYQWSNGESSEDISGLAAGTYQVTVTDAQSCSTTQSQVISEPATIVPLISSTTINGVNIACFGESTGTATVSVTGGTPAYTYLWSNGATEASISNLPAGPVSVTVTDANACAGFGGPFTLTQPAAALNVIIDSISTYAGGFNISCSGQSDGGIFIAVSGGTIPYSYFWSNAETTKDITGLSAGTYTVTVVDFNGCTQSADAVITPPAPFNVTLSSPTFPGGTNIGCNGENSGSATANPAGGAAPYTYLWNNAEITQTITGLVAGTYSVSVTDANGCTGEGSVTLTEPGVVVPLITGVLVNGGTNILCFGESGASAIASATGGSLPYTYTWSNGQTDNIATGLSAGVVSVTVSDINNCSKSTSFTVTEPDELLPSISVDVFNGGYNVGCNGGNNGAIDLTVTGGTTAYTFNWSNAEITEDITGLTAGTYTVTVTDANGCTATAQGVLTEPDPIQSAAASPLKSGGFNISCNGASDGTIDLTVSGGATPYTYSWDNGETDEDLSGLSGGTYSVTVTDANSCTTTSSVVLTEPDALGSVTVSPTFVGGDNVSCNGLFDGSIDLTVSGGSTPYTFLWSNGILTEDNPNLGAGTYGVTVTDASGCTTTSSITLTEPDPVTPSATLSSYNGNNITCAGSTTGSISVNVTGGASPYSYVWTNINDATTQTVTGLGAGTYEVIVTDANGCIGTYTATLTEPDSLKSSSLSPVFAGGFNLSCNGSNTGSIDLTVTGGTSAYTYYWDNSETTEDLTNLGAGTYNVTITDANGCTNVAATTLIEPDELSPVAVSPTYSGGSNISCNSNTDGSIDLTVTGGTSPYTYSWDNGETTEDLTNLGADTYSVTVTDANGCTAATSATLTEPQPLTAPTVESSYNGGYNIACNGSTTGSIDLTPAGGTPSYTYSWDNGETTEDLTNLGAGTYNVTVTDANGCTVSTSVELTEPAPVGNTLTSPTFNGGYNVTCLGNNGGIDLTVTGGATPYTYSWDNSETTEDLTGLGAGTYNVTVADANGCTSTGSIELIQSPPTDINADLSAYNGSNISCNGSTDGNIDLTVTGGAAPYTYNWDNSETTEDLSGLGAGTYTVTVTDANGCTATASATLTEPDPLTAPTVASNHNGGYNIACNGSTTGSIDLTPAGGTASYTYSWDNGETTEDLTNLGAGTYNVTVTDANSCTVTASVELTQPDSVKLVPVSPTFAGGDNVTCLGNDGSVNLTVSGGTTDYTYTWSNGATTADITGLGADTYSVTVVDANGCSETASITLTQTGDLAVVLDAPTYNGENHISCNGSADGSISSEVTGGATPYTYTWSNGATTEDLTGLTAGYYTLTVTDANNCAKQKSITLTEPDVLSAANIAPSDVLCFGEANGSADITVAGGSSPYTYLWDNAETTEDISGLSIGTYSVTVTDAVGCSATGSVVINQPELLTASVDSYTDTLGCNSAGTGAISISVSEGTVPYTYLWSNGSTDQNISGLNAGTYSVTVTDANGCTAELTSSVVIVQTGIVQISSDPTDVTGCFANANGAIDLTISDGQPPYTYTWSNGETTQDISGLTAGNYSVTVDDVNGCSNTTSVTINEPPQLTVAVSPASAQVSCNGAADGSVLLNVSGGTMDYTYNWSGGEVSASISGLAPGTYEVTVTDANGCTATGSQTVTEPEILTATVESYTDTLGCAAAGTGYINIETEGGTLAYTYTWSNGVTTQNLSGLDAGTYNVTVTDANGCTVVLTDPVVIIQTGIVQLSANPADVTGCFGNTNGSVDLTVNDGQPPYTYTWSNGATTQNNSGLAAGTYFVTVDDVNGCFNTTSVTINEPPQLTVAVSPASAQVSCNGAADGSVLLNVSGGTMDYTYNWSGGEVSASISGLAPGTYEVTVTDANGCTATASQTVTEPEILTATVESYTDTLGCAAAGTGYINIETEGGTPSYTYNWSNGATTQNISGLSAGIFNVTVTDAQGCSATLDTSLTVVVTGVVTIDKTVTDVVACFGDSTGAIELNISDGQSPYTYTWGNGATTQTITGLKAGVYTVTVDDVNGCSNSTSITVQEPSKLTAAVSGASTDVSCKGFEDGKIELSISGGTGSYTYNWSNNETTESLSGLAPGTYDVTVSDANGCTAITSREITEPEELTIQLVNYTDTLGCNASGTGSIEISVTGGTQGYAYHWSNGATQQQLSGLMASTYNVTVTDAHGCTANLPADLTIVQTDKPQLTANATDVTGCNGDSNGSVALTVKDGQAPYTYTWSNGADTKDISGIEAGNYTVTVLDVNGCSATASATVNEPPKLQVSVNSQSTKNVSCKDAGDGQVWLNVSGGTGDYTYHWSNSETTESLSGLTPGTYDVTVSDANGCTATTSREITEPDSLKVTTASYTDTIRCGKGNLGSIDIDVQGGTQGYVYQWSSGQSTQDLSGIYGGTYNVTVTDANGCHGTLSFVIVQLQPVSVSLTATPISGCHGDSTGAISPDVSGGDGNYTYHWSNNATTASLTGLKAGEYSLTVTDASGCSGTSFVTVSEPAQMLLQFTATSPGCNNGIDGSVQLSVSGGTSPYTYLWSTGATTQNLTGLAAQMYYVTVTDTNKCAPKVDSIEVINPSAVAATATVVRTPCGNENTGTITVSAEGGTSPYTYNWSKGSSTTETAMGLEPGTYSITVTDAHGCSDTTSAVMISMAIDLRATSPSCHGAANGSIDLTVAGGIQPFTYIWSTGATTEDISGLKAVSDTVLVLDSKGCVIRGTTFITDPPIPQFSAGSDQNVCLGNAVLSAYLPPEYQGTWTKLYGTGEIAEKNSPKTTVTGVSTGEESYIWTITNGICTFADTVTLTIGTIEANAGSDMSVCDTAHLRLSAYVDEGTYGIWSSDNKSVIFDNIEDPNTIVHLDKRGRYKLFWTIQNQLGCISKDSIVVTFKSKAACDTLDLDMPTGFSPNFDGFNDYFVIHGILRYPENELRVYNRWGNLVYKSENYHNEWRGQNLEDRPLPDGTYFVILKTKQPEEKTLTGYVDLRR